MSKKKSPGPTATIRGGRNPKETPENRKQYTTTGNACQIKRARMRQENEKPGYWAVIPAKVRYDEELRPNAKLLYAEITALSNAEGYCWASNDRLAAWYGISPKTVGALIQQLAEKGYITVELLRDESRAITGRRIWIDRPTDAAPPILKNEETPLKNEETPILKNEERNNTRVKNNPPEAPQRGPRARREPMKTPAWKPERFEGFWQYYPIHTSKQAAMRAWDRLKPGDELIATIGKALRRQMATEQWTRGIGIPYAATYLNQRRWEDEVERAPKAAEGRKEAEVEWLL